MSCFRRAALIQRVLSLCRQPRHGHHTIAAERTVEVADGTLQVVARRKLDDAAHAVAVDALDVRVLWRDALPEKVLRRAEVLSGCRFTGAGDELEQKWLRRNEWG